MTAEVPHRIYMDNAATSFPKPRAVLDAMRRYAEQLGASPGRGAYRESIESGELIASCRRRINQLIGGENPDHVIFTLNCTDALNLAIKGIVQPGDHVICCDMDHNSILRPLNGLAAAGLITLTRVQADPRNGMVDPNDIRAAVTPRTRLIAMLHASNVTGTLQDIAAIGQVARECELVYLVDAAQSLGHYPINVRELGIDLLAAPGHKGLMGPLGTGILYVRPGIEGQMRPLREGGTGSVSEMDTQPEFMPDRFEAGSHNTIGIAGLSEGVAWILDRGVEQVWANEQSLIQTMLESMADITLYGPRTGEQRCGVFSVGVDGLDPHELSAIMESEYGILTRSGLHCAPGAHTTMGTLERGGTTRLSFGPFTEQREVKYAAEALGEVCHRMSAVGTKR